MANDKWGAGALGRALSLATNLVAAIGAGYFLGDFLDKRFGTGPWLTLICFLLGVATGLKMMYETAFGKMEKPEDVPKISDLKSGLSRLKEVKKQLKKSQEEEEKNDWYKK